MPNDNPYFLDFLLNNIVDVRFGGTWCVVTGLGESAFGGGSFSVDLKCSFPSIAGGTPGFTIMTGMSPIAGVRAPHVLTPKDLGKKIKTDAGATLSAFTMNKGPSADPFKQTAGAIFIQCTGPFAEKFPVRVDAIASFGNFYNIVVGIYKDRTIKAGLLVDLFGSGVAASVLPVPDSLNNIAGEASQSATFTVDPKKITVV